MLNNTDFNTICASQCSGNTVCKNLTEKLGKGKHNDSSFVDGKLVVKMKKISNKNTVIDCQSNNWK